jgi:hypothetical protein
MGDYEAETKPMTRRPRILVINPNSNEAVTEGLRQAVLPLTYAEGPEIACTTLTEGPYGIEKQEHETASRSPAPEGRGGRRRRCLRDRLLFRPGLRRARRHGQAVFGIAEAES